MVTENSRRFRQHGRGFRRHSGRSVLPFSATIQCKVYYIIVAVFGDYSHRFWRPKRRLVAENGNYSRQFVAVFGDCSRWTATIYIVAENGDYFVNEALGGI